MSVPSIKSTGPALLVLALSVLALLMDVPELASQVPAYPYDIPAYDFIRFDSLIRIVQNAVPDAAILLTVPNDGYLYRRYINPNTARVREVLPELAEEYNCGVWDFYTVMGGLNSIVVWQRFGLARRDTTHFTVKGYLLQGNLFFNAFLKSYDNFIDHSNRTNLRP